jgi:hypothetical protein
VLGFLVTWQGEFPLPSAVEAVEAPIRAPEFLETAYESILDLDVLHAVPVLSGRTVRTQLCDADVVRAAVLRREELIRARYVPAANEPAGPRQMPMCHGEQLSDGHRRRLIARTRDQHDASHPIDHIKLIKLMLISLPRNGDRGDGWIVRPCRRR